MAQSNLYSTDCGKRFSLMDDSCCLLTRTWSNVPRGVCIEKTSHSHYLFCGFNQESRLSEEVNAKLTFLCMSLLFFFFFFFYFFLSVSYAYFGKTWIQTLHSLVLSEKQHSKKYIKIDLGFRPKPFRTMVIKLYMEASLNVALILSLITFPVALRGFMWRKYKAEERKKTQHCLNYITVKCMKSPTINWLYWSAFQLSISKMKKWK